MSKLSWAILFGHVAFASRNALPQQDQHFEWVSASYVGSIWGQSTAILWPCWCHLGANFDDFGAVLKATAIWDHFGHVAKALSKTTQRYTSKPLPPVALRPQPISWQAKKGPPSRAI